MPTETEAASDALNKLQTQVNGLKFENVTKSMGEFGGVVAATLKKVGEAAIPAATGLYSVGSGADSAAKVLTGIGDKLGGPIRGLVSTFVETQADLRKAQQYNLASNFPDFQAQAAKAGMTTEQLTKNMGTLGPNMLSLAGDTMSATQRFAKFGEALNDTGVARTLKGFGVTADEVTRYGQSMIIGTKANVANSEAMKDLARDSAFLAATLKEQTSITGISTEKLSEELQARISGTDARLSMQMMDEEQRRGYIKTQAVLGQFGGSVQDLADKVSTNARLTDKDLNTLNAMGPVAGEFQKAIRMQQMARTESEKAQADAALKRVQADLLAWQSSSQFSRLMKNSSGEVQAAGKEMYGATTSLQGYQRTIQDGAARGLNADQALEERRRKVAADIAGKTPDGAAKPGDVATRALNEMQERARINAAGAAQNLADVNTALGKTPEAANATRKAIGLLSDTLFGTAKTIDDAATRNAQNLKKLIDMLGGLPSNPLAPGANNPLNQINTQVPGRSGTPNADRDIGTLGVTGQMKEPKDIVAQLHKDERVLSPKENKDLTNLFDMFTNFKPGSTPGMNPTDMINKIASMPKVKIPEGDKAKVSGVDKPPPSSKPPVDVGAILNQFKTPEMGAMPGFNSIIEMAKTKAAEKAAAPSAPAPSAPAISTAGAGQGKEYTMNDVVSAINDLNKTMNRMLSHTENISSNSEATSRIAGKMTGNRMFAG